MKVAIALAALVAAGSSKAAVDPEIVHLAAETTAYFVCAAISVDSADPNVFIAAGIRTGTKFLQAANGKFISEAWDVAPELTMLGSNGKTPIEFRLGEALVMIENAHPHASANATLEQIAEFDKKQYRASNCGALLPR